MKINFFIREFWKSFSDFISDFIVVAESFYKGILKSFSSKCFQSLGIEPSVILYIYYMVDKGKSSFLQNIVEEIRPGCRNLQRSQIMVNLSEIFLGGMMLEVQSGVWI